MKARLKEKIRIDEKDTLYIFDYTGITNTIVPGQFFEIKIGKGLDPFLRRPVSIFDIKEREISFLIRTAGKGTQIMTEWEKGKEIDLLGPLGNGFQIFDEKKNILLVGGGIGVAPLYFLAKKLLEYGNNITLLFMPGRNRQLLEAFSQIRNNINIVYSENRKQLPEVLKNQIQEKSVDVIYTCGPMAMMQKVVEISDSMKIPSQVSLEAKMGCGIGICMGCVISVKKGKDDSEYKRVCHDGPVFSGKEVIF